MKSASIKTYPLSELCISNGFEPHKITFPYRYIACVDFECTCEDSRIVGSGYSHEIIEFPVIIYDLGKHVHKRNIKYYTPNQLMNDVSILDEFHAYVRPIEHPILSSFCKEFTGISQDDVNGAPTLPEVLSLFNVNIIKKHKISPSNTLLITDTNSDVLSFLLPECRRKGINVPKFFTEFCDIRQCFQKIAIMNLIDSEELNGIISKDYYINSGYSEHTYNMMDHISHGDQFSNIDQFSHNDNFNNIEHFNNVDEFNNINNFNNLENFNNIIYNSHMETADNVQDNLNNVDNFNNIDHFNNVDNFNNVEHFSNVDEFKNINDFNNIMYNTNVNTLDSVHYNANNTDFKSSENGTVFDNHSPTEKYSIGHIEEVLSTFINSSIFLKFPETFPLVFWIEEYNYQLRYEKNTILPMHHFKLPRDNSEIVNLLNYTYRQLNIEKMLELCSLQFHGSRHSGRDDTFNLGRIFLYIFNALHGYPVTYFIDLVKVV